MKTLIILSAFLLALSSCTKEMPVPDPDPYPDPVYISDPDPAADTPPDSNDDDESDNDDDSDDDDPSPYCYNDHPGSSATWMAATSFNPVGQNRTIRS
jgi:hypothetical protein